MCDIDDGHECEDLFSGSPSPGRMHTQREERVPEEDDNTLDEFGHPLRDAIYVSHASMPDSVLALWVQGVRDWVRQFGNVLPVATAFSGCDVAMKACQELTRLYDETYGLS